MKKSAVGFGLDFARFNFSSKKYRNEFEHMFLGLSANSNITTNYFMNKEFDCQFYGTGTKDILTFQRDGVPYICIEKIKDNGLFKDISYIVIFYGLFFKFKKSREIFVDFIRKYPDCKVTRIDIALDLPIAINDFLDNGFITKYRKVTKFGENLATGGLETIYFGAKGCSNKRQFIRVYDKLKDIYKKNKLVHHLDLLNYKNITRVELQVNSLSCSEFEIEPLKILDKVFVLEVFRKCCYNDKFTYFKGLDNFLLEIDFVDDIKVVRRKSKKEMLNEIRDAKMMLAYAQKLVDCGFDVYSYLVRELK